MHFVTNIALSSFYKSWLETIYSPSVVRVITVSVLSLREVVFNEFTAVGFSSVIKAESLFSAVPPKSKWRPISAVPLAIVNVPSPSTPLPVILNAPPAACEQACPVQPPDALTTAARIEILLMLYLCIWVISNRVISVSWWQPILFIVFFLGIMPCKSICLPVVSMRCNSDKVDLMAITTDITCECSGFFFRGVTCIIGKCSGQCWKKKLSLLFGSQFFFVS